MTSATSSIAAPHRASDGRDAGRSYDSGSPSNYPNWIDYTAYAAFHLACLSAIWVAPTATDIIVGGVLYFLSSFGLSVGWHRYLSHRSFKTSRWFQFFLVLCGTLSWLKGGLWFAQFHGYHHRMSDRPVDVHSPLARGFLYSHSFWFLKKCYRDTDYSLVPQWAVFPELVWLNKWTWALAIAMGTTIFVVLGVSGLVWSFFISTVLFWHTFKGVGTFCHSFGGYRRFATTDNSRNNPVIGLFGFGEGWHNNHHHMPYSARLGIAWWEIDLGWWAIWLFERLGLVWDVRRPAADVMDPDSPRGSRQLARLDRWHRQLRRHLLEDLAGKRSCAEDSVSSILSLLAMFETDTRSALHRRPLRLRRALNELRHGLHLALAADPKLAARLDGIVFDHVRCSSLAHLWLPREQWHLCTASLPELRLFEHDEKPESEGARP